MLPSPHPSTVPARADARSLKFTHTNSELGPRSARQNLAPPLLGRGLVEDLRVGRGPLREVGGGSELLGLVDLLDQRLEHLPVVLEGLLVGCGVSSYH